MKDRPYASAEQYERWFIRDCARCGRRACKAANWEGPICRTCCDRAARTYGTCPGCGTHRLLPGRCGGTPVCRDCAGIARDFHCTQCGAEGLLLRGRLCERCSLADRLTAALDDGTGRINPDLRPFFDGLCAIPTPRTGLNWLLNPQVPKLLSDLATGRIALTHRALHVLPNWRTAAHLRDLLMEHGVLPRIDKQLLHFETWLHHRLVELDDSPHLPLLRQFGTWHQLPELRRRATWRPLTPSTRRFASEQFTRAREFLTWLNARNAGLDQLAPADIDEWHAAHLAHEIRSLRAFLNWAMATGRAPRLPLPAQQTRRGEVLTQRRRLELVRKVLNSGYPARLQMAACLMLLYAQPASRIVRLTLDDITHDADGEVVIRLGEPPTPVPEPFDELFLQAKEERSSSATGTNPDSRWLFPGRRAGQPITQRTLANHIRDLGIPAQAARTAALRQLVLQAPAPVIARSLGFHDVTTTRIAADAGGPWSRYAPDCDSP